MLPAEWGDVGEERVGNDLASSAQGIESATEIHGVPQSDRRGDQRQAAGAMLLRFEALS